MFWRVWLISPLTQRQALTSASPSSGSSSSLPAPSSAGSGPSIRPSGLTAPSISSSSSSFSSLKSSFPSSRLWGFPNGETDVFLFLSLRASLPALTVFCCWTSCKTLASCLQFVALQCSSSLIGWISAISVIGSNKAVGAIMMVVAAFFTAAAALSVVLLKMVHSHYRRTGASFQKAQQEFSQGVLTNRTFQSAATSAATTAAQSSLQRN
ncbi:secretory carrier-associated membrane protein 2 isoform X1 [Danio rerio]|uniref:Secretory carrier-associated membrane protein 2 isoform X1 n=1 Tax=Danio rerio TaxID=7955 RepID=A0AC58IUY8_DANRE